MTSAIDRRELSFKAGAGLLGGALGWVPVEITTHGHSLTQAMSAGEMLASFVAMAVLSGLIGGFVNAADLQTTSWSPAVTRRFVIGFVVCFLLGVVANYLSDRVFSYFLTLGGWGLGRQGSVAYLIVARVFSWMLMGLLLGAGVGIASASRQNILKGAAGGLVGGFIGGISFDLIGAIAGGGILPRFLGLSAVGLAIGLFIGLVQELTKTAWLSVTAGRLRGRQFRLDAATTMIGRAEENPVGLFGDPGVQARHAVVERRGDDYLIRNLAVQAGTLVNGSRIETAPLNEGDRIAISNYELVFHLRAATQSQAERAPTLATAQAAGFGSAAAMSALPRTAASNHGPVLVSSRGDRYALPVGATIRVGRALDNDIVLSDASVSRHHAALEVLSGSLRLRDLSSQNGTWVDGRRIGEEQLTDGASFRLGDAVLTFHA
jgi:pSer/pThr/pTyr-binding forkhead associated (FHA) protein